MRGKLITGDNDHHEDGTPKAAEESKARQLIEALDRESKRLQRVMLHQGNCYKACAAGMFCITMLWFCWMIWVDHYTEQGAGRPEHRSV